MSNNDIRNMRNVREKPVKELMGEYKAKEQQQKEISKAHKEALREEKRKTSLRRLQATQTEQKARLQEQMEIQKQKAEIRRLKQETGLVGKAKRLQQRVKARQQAIQKKGEKPSITPSVKKSKIDGKIYFIKGVPYHYKGGRMVKVPVGKSKPKKKKEEFTL